MSALSQQMERELSTNSRNEDIYANANRFKPERPIGETIAEEQPSLERTGESKQEDSIFHGKGTYKLNS